MTTTVSSHNTEPRDTVLVAVTRACVEFTRTRVMHKGRDPHTGRFMEEPRTVRKCLDSDQTIGKLDIEHLSSAVLGGRECVREDSSQRIPGDIHSPLDGRANEYNPRKGERDDMSDNATSKVATSLASERRYPSVFALSIVFGGGVGQTAFSMLGLPAGGGFLVGSAMVFLALASAVLISRARSESQIKPK